ncbi:hypothetical protein BRC96_09245 [Halobacteriales archaeon QS_6_64_34]|nr:MAG: hypothetical protein BRC96_09245 [Halobacteriales archaeon QS_6_64_34]
MPADQPASGGAERGRVLSEPRRRKHATRAQRVAGAENAGAFWHSETVSAKVNTTEDDLCADAWVQPDQLGMMKQLDAVDVPEMKL